MVHCDLHLSRKDSQVGKSGQFAQNRERHNSQPLPDGRPTPWINSVKAEKKNRIGQDGAQSVQHGRSDKGPSGLRNEWIEDRVKLP